MNRGIAERAAGVNWLAACEHMPRKSLDTATRNTLLLAPAGFTRQGLPPGEGPPVERSIPQKCEQDWYIKGCDVPVLLFVGNQSLVGSVFLGDKA